ncbi:unnamed protein product [Fraxinus pennsylvanica]|uniref:Uncharacterized protein n=1 Tax=Fraxinus pennsylvanica TaxID=56036 RepID=A0AAD2EDR2_9LAMI|nr:unnamed protein product [Fraxinus pennsylvanica]
MSNWKVIHILMFLPLLVLLVFDSTLLELCRDSHGPAFVVESSFLDKGKSPQVVEPTGDMPESPRIADEGTDDIVRSIQNLFTSWGQVKTPRPTSTSHSSASSSTFSEENMKSLKQSVFEYMSFMYMEIGQASATKQNDKCELLSAKLAQALTLSIESLLLEINKDEDELNEISSEVMIEDSLMISSAAEMKEFRAKMNYCRAMMATKKCNASQGIE